jgi:hypothetical protein
MAAHEVVLFYPAECGKGKELAYPTTYIDELSVANVVVGASFGFLKLIYPKKVIPKSRSSFGPTMRSSRFSFHLKLKFGPANNGLVVSYRLRSCLTQETV